MDIDESDKDTIRKSESKILLSLQNDYKNLISLLQKKILPDYNLFNDNDIFDDDENATTTRKLTANINYNEKFIVTQIKNLIQKKY
jgi:hypothetical protein